MTIPIQCTDIRELVTDKLSYVAFSSRSNTLFYSLFILLPGK